MHSAAVKAMGFKFRSSKRSFKIFPGVRINTGKKGINSVSIGGRGKIFGSTTNINFKTGKTRQTYSVKGLGSISSTSSSSGNASKSTKPKVQNIVTSNQSWYQNEVLIALLAILLPPIGIPLVAISEMENGVKITLSIIAVIVLMIFY